MAIHSFEQKYLDAVKQLAAIDDALGLPQDGCDWPPRALDEIRRLTNEVRDLNAFVDGMQKHIAAAADMYGLRKT